MLRISPIGKNKTFEINGAHITVIEDKRSRQLRTLGTPEFDASWYDESHKNVMRLVYELEDALLALGQVEEKNKIEHSQREHDINVYNFGACDDDAHDLG